MIAPALSAPELPFCKQQYQSASAASQRPACGPRRHGGPGPAAPHPSPVTRVQLINAQGHRGLADTGGPSRKPKVFTLRGEPRWLTYFPLKSRRSRCRSVPVPGDCWTVAGQVARPAILTRLWANTPCPTRSLLPACGSGGAPFAELASLCPGWRVLAGWRVEALALARWYFG
jgi:hypothetical protein